MGKSHLHCCGLQTPDSFGLGVKRCVWHSLVAWCSNTSILWTSSNSLAHLGLVQSLIKRWHQQQCYVCLLCTWFWGCTLQGATSTGRWGQKSILEHLVSDIYGLYRLLIFVPTACPWNLSVSPLLPAVQVRSRCIFVVLWTISCWKKLVTDYPEWSLTLVI